MAEKQKVVIDVDIEAGDAIKRLEKLESAMFRTQEEAAEMAKRMEEGFDSAGKGAKKASKGVGGFGSTLKGIVGGIGILALIQKAFEMLMEVVGNNQEAADFLATAFEALQIILTKILSEAVVPLAKWLVQLFTEPQTAIDSFVDATKPVQKFFEDLGKYISSTFMAEWTKLTLGIDEVRLKWNQLTGDTEEAQEIQEEMVKKQLQLLEYQKESAESAEAVVNAVAAGVQAVVQTVTETVMEAVTAADQIVKLRNAAEIAEAQMALQMLATQEQAELQRQIRDDISKGIAERIQANNELGKILSDQAEDERRIAQVSVDSANAQIAAYGQNTERLVALINAKKELADVDERITGQKSEQMTNEIALEKELFDYQQELRLLGKTERELEFEELEIEMERLFEIKRLAGDTEVDIEAEKETRLNEIRERHRQEDLEAQKKYNAKIKKDQDKVDKSKVGAAKGVAGALGQIGAAMQQAGIANSGFMKALAVGEIAINAAIATAAAIKNAVQSSGSPWDMIANIAVAVGTVAAAIGSATALLNQAEGPPAPTMNVDAGASAPSISSAASSSTELGGSEQAQLAPIQAFVIETEMTGNQQNINQIENQVTFGIDG
tara:strand:+ start:2120 stop:3949 length:1830 start_codon:yes stop_codon:yes gene_type:complete